MAKTKTKTLTAAAPDGTQVSVTVSDADTGPACNARNMYSCSLTRGHDGPWHIADTGAEIVEVWPA
jgi:hypothetical protein